MKVFFSSLESIAFNIQLPEVIGFFFVIEMHWHIRFFFLPQLSIILARKAAQFQKKKYINSIQLQNCLFTDIFWYFFVVLLSSIWYGKIFCCILKKERRKNDLMKTFPGWSNWNNFWSASTKNHSISMSFYRDDRQPNAFCFDSWFL